MALPRQPFWCSSVKMRLLPGTKCGTRQLALMALSLHCSEDGKCPCSCDYVTDPTCGCRDIAGGVDVSLTKTPVYATYPLLYARSFNAKPYEVRTVHRED
jgi:hypothetical protein